MRYAALEKKFSKEQMLEKYQHRLLRQRQRRRVSREGLLLEQLKQINLVEAAMLAGVEEARPVHPMAGRSRYGAKATRDYVLQG